MTAPRSRKEEKTYKTYLKGIDHTGCVFCQIQAGSDQLVEETKYFKIIKNLFAYSIWDGQQVVDHLMIVPKTHTDTLANMTDSQKIEYVNLIEKYEKLHYNTYTRVPSSTVKSISHQHTHLIKLEGYTKWFVLLIRKPYFRLAR